MHFDIQPAMTMAIDGGCMIAMPETRRLSAMHIRLLLLTRSPSHQSAKTRCCYRLPRLHIEQATTDLSFRHIIMLALSVIVTLLSAAPTTLSAPAGIMANSTEPYNCGYVRTRPNSSAVAGIFAYDACMPFSYNETIHDYEKAFAYTLYGGCTCHFYR